MKTQLTVPVLVVSLTSLMATAHVWASAASAAPLLPAAAGAAAVGRKQSDECSANRAPAKMVTLDAKSPPALRTGQEIARIAGLGRLLGSFRECSGERVVVRYPAGVHGALWAGKLRGWLVALGVPSVRIVFNPDLRPGDDSVTISIKRRGEQRL